MTTLTLAQCIEIAKNDTARAKAVKAWRLKKASKTVQQFDMPKGYIIATTAEVREMLINAGVKTDMKADGRKGVWAMHSTLPGRNGRVSINMAPIAFEGEFADE